MGTLYLMTTIIDRKMSDKYLNVFRENNLHVIYRTHGLNSN